MCYSIYFLPVVWCSFLAGGFFVDKLRFLCATQSILCATQSILCATQSILCATQSILCAIQSKNIATTLDTKGLPGPI